MASLKDIGKKITGNFYNKRAIEPFSHQAINSNFLIYIIGFAFV